jgi:antitoxin component of RelBE/YafQ-DinJ toxin-antitoxin module
MRHNVAQILTLDAMATSPKNETIRVRITEATKIELQVLADADNRILSDYIRIELEKMIAEKKLPKENT